MVKLNLSTIKLQAPSVEETKKENGSATGNSAGQQTPAAEEDRGAGTPDAAAQGTGESDHTIIGRDIGVSGADEQRVGESGSGSQDGAQLSESSSGGSQSDISDGAGNGGAESDSAGVHPVRPASDSPAGKLKGLNLGKTPVAPSPPAPVSGPVDSLAALAADESTGLPQMTGFDTPSGYIDEIPATAPDREVPPELVEQAKGFVDSLNSMYDKTILSDPEFFGQMIRNIMMELQNNPQYSKLICDDDVAVMIRGMRESMGMARLKKQENKRGKGGSTKSKKAADKAGSEMLDGLADLAASMGMTFDD